MDKPKFYIIVISVMVLLVFSFIYGYRLMGGRINKKPLEPSDELEIVKEDEVISPNTFIEKKIYYKECDHTITDTRLADEVLVNKNEEEFREYMSGNYQNTKIISFSPERILLREERNHLCPNHYVIGESDGKIAIFKINESGERVVDKIFKDYPIYLLREVDQKKLKEGIVVDSEEELSDVLENFIS